MISVPVLFLSTPSARRATPDRPSASVLHLRFLSTPSARRATTIILLVDLFKYHFYPRPPRGGRLRFRVVPCSISNFYPRPPRGGRRKQRARYAGQQDFYPRPPRGGRREPFGLSKAQKHFYPRPPRGGRRSIRLGYKQYVKISIHALREEGDCRR